MIRSIAGLIVLVAFCALLSGCSREGQEGSAEQAGKKIDAAVDSARSAAATAAGPKTRQSWLTALPTR